MKTTSSNPNSSEDPRGRGRGSEIKSSTAIIALPEQELDLDIVQSRVQVSISQVQDRLSSIQADESIAGQVLDGRYKVLGTVGEGAMAVVHCVREIETGHIFAAKSLKYRDEELEARFAREVKIYEKLKHPNIVDARECLVGPESSCVSIMELVEGDSLEKMLGENGPITDPEVFASIMSQLCDGLEYAHQRGVIHRDLKPDNIIIRSASDGVNIKILDFGLAKLQEDLQRITKTGIVLGSPAYMSPEQCMGDPLDERSDIYSLGVLAFEMLTGKLPYEEKTPVTMMQAHCNPDRLPLTLSSANIRSLRMVPFQSILSKMLEYESVDRYENINDLKRDLHQWWQDYVSSPKGDYQYFSHVKLPRLKELLKNSDQEISIEEKVELESLINKQINTRVKTASEKFKPSELPKRKFDPRTFMPLAMGCAALIVVATVLLIAHTINSMKSKSHIEPAVESRVIRETKPLQEKKISPPSNSNRRKIVGPAKRF